MDQSTAKKQTQVARGIRLKRLARAYPEVRAVLEELEALRAKAPKAEKKAAEAKAPKAEKKAAE